MLAHSLSKQANSQRTMPSTDSIPLLSLNNERKHPLPKYGMLWHYVNLSEFTVRQFSVLSQRSRFHFAATCNTATAKVRYAILHVIWGAITTNVKLCTLLFSHQKPNANVHFSLFFFYFFVFVLHLWDTERKNGEKTSTCH